MLTGALFLPVGMLVRALEWLTPAYRHKWVENASLRCIPNGGPHTTGAGFR